MKEKDAAMLERMSRLRAMRGKSKGAQAVEAAVKEEVISSEVQAVIEAMTPERKMRLAEIQARTLATQEAQEALRRHEAERRAILAVQAVEQKSPVIEPPVQGLPERIGSREVNLIVRTDGTIVSRDGPCVCGKAKREWHLICLKEAEHG